MRDVAGDAGVDAALVSRYFGSKDDLFAAALDTCGDCGTVDGPREGFGERLAHDLVYGDVEEDDLTGLLIMLRSIGSVRAGQLVRDFVQTRFNGPLAEWIGGPDAPVRCALVSSLMLGVAVNRDLGGCAALTDAQKADLHRRLAAALHAFVED